MGPLFGSVLARALDRWWVELGRPDPYLVVEAGAGVGTLAASILSARPECSAALRYVTVERSAALRELARQRLPLELPSLVLGPAAADAEAEEVRPVEGTGPLVTMLAELPAHGMTGITIANELLDNLPFMLVERRAEGWCEVRVGEDGGRLAEVVVQAPEDAQLEAERFAPSAPEGARVPLQRAARRWVADALAGLERGRVVIVDYADTTANLAARPQHEWLRTYRRHGRGGAPLVEPGTQDVTCEVAIDQLVAVRPPERVSSQTDFLREHGIDALVEEARAAWRAGAGVGGLDALKARSRVNEGAALTDPAGLGAFVVVEWAAP